ncbi:unnamed protein product [Arctia plantaginis]|uniref:Uncharacterized protein n=1 Tax=Arctia plantaginis TaxID=874455 RepID=A0A8S0YZB2_ARCPL|nr:unnamed protein product [Arctia plantaginis]CAB3256629.1 unnamed protein product [Arctia plantaginis]
MTTATKGQKDKPFSNPRLVPRPTAASAARAARNATNRNLTSLPSRQSPTRTPVSPKLQGKASVQRALKSDSKTEVKINNYPEIEVVVEKKAPIEELQTFTVEKPLAVGVIEEETTGNQDEFIIDVNNVPEKEIIVTGDLEFKNPDDNEKLNEGDLQLSCLNNEPRSRPNTPSLSSRPQTPRSMQSSRPQTPRMPSRPTTPAHPVQRQSTPTSRPNTPQCAPISRPRTPSAMVVPPSSRVLSPSSVCSHSRSLKEEEDVRATFIAKQKQFRSLKMELDLKQQVVLEAFDNLRALREQMARENGVTEYGEGLQLQELVVFNVADWTSEEISQLCRDAAASSPTDGTIEIITNTLPIDECTLVDINAKVLSVPAHFADLCLQAFTARQEIIDWVKELIGQTENGGGESLERIARYNAHGLELCESLRALKSRSDDAVDAISQLAKRVFHERGALMAVGESLVREIARLRNDLETHSNAIKALQASRNEMSRNRACEDVRKELEEERATRVATKEKLGSTESQLRQARLRITKMDRQLREAEASIASLTSTVKALEDQSRQREALLESRARKLKESLKTGEISSSQLVQQRDALQFEVQELKQQIETMASQQKSMMQELNNQLKESQAVLENQYQLTQRVNEQKEATEAALGDAQNTIEELTSKISELESRPISDLPTEREMDLWAELQSTKDTLRITEEEMATCKREKVRFLETLTKISGTENKVGMQQKLAAELLSKEEILGKMQLQIRELTKNIKLNEQKVIQYEQFIRDLQTQNRTITLNQADGNGYEELQQEIMNLRIALLEAVHRNEELSEQLIQKDQQLEQQDKTSRAQVREELINMLKNKETEQSRELGALQQDLEHRMKIVDDVNKQIAAKADEIQELFKTLENKQQQIHRLEKIVLALEEQQRRAQAQRTRNEEKIAALEHELAANGSRKERKYLFF